MEHTFTENCIIGEIVTKFPQASDLFKSYRIDFCFGGNRPLLEAINERNLSSEQVVTNLNTHYQDTKLLNEATVDWEHAASTLINHIVSVRSGTRAPRKHFGTHIRRISLYIYQDYASPG
jgi:regulator of cell morphogenesis and NO signaling